MSQLQDSSLQPSDSSFFTTAAMVKRDLKVHQAAITFAMKAVELDQSDFRPWKCWIDSLISLQDYQHAQQIAQKAVEALPLDTELRYLLGLSYHLQKRFDVAVQHYHTALTLAPDHMYIRINLAAAYQELGESDKAYIEYKLVIPHMPNDAPVRNNFGVLLGNMGKPAEEEEYWLLDALRIDPNFVHALGNLGGVYQDEGMLDLATEYLQRSLNNGADYRMTKLRIATLISPLHPSWEHVVMERRSLVEKISELITNTSHHRVGQPKVDNNYDRVHFYVSFHGMNDRYLQELMAQVYTLFVKGVDFVKPSLLTTQALMQLTTASNSTNKIRIGFISKYFGIFEPHGMLLDGTMAYLPRDQFEVVCLFVARTDVKPISPVIRIACDQMYEVSTSLEHAQLILQDIPLDVLVFADANCEPINHFLTYSRHAPIQIGFWGTPITSGSQYIDYFISAAAMESPYRTRMPSTDDPYTEQVLLLDGQGIWYYRPVDPDLVIVQSNMSGKIGKARTYTRAQFNISDDCFLFLMPQSTFKIHPLFDLVIKEIMLKNDRIHLAVTAGRRLRWTSIYATRIITTLGPVLSQRFHVIERVSSECFYNFLALADAVLHPFPFDGSRTSADVLIVEKPYVTLPTEYLRGRMGYSFLRTMNIPQLVAVDIQDYIEIAARLAADHFFYTDIVQKIKQNADLIWEDIEFPYGITTFLQRLFGLPISSYEVFLLQTGRNVSEEILRTSKRQANMHLFDQAFGEQRWQLDEDGALTLPSLVKDADDWPRLFDHWRRSKLRQLPTSTQRQLPTPPQRQQQITEEKDWLKQFRQYSRKGLFAEAFQLIRQVQAEDPSALPMTNPIFVMELGSLQFFRGEYQDALNLCGIAAELSPQFVESYGCMGVAAMYLPDHHNKSTDFLYKTFVMKRNLLLSNAVDDNSIDTSPVFSMPMESVIFNLITALTSLKQFSLCGKIAAEVLSFPPYDQGGMHLVIFSFIKWSELGWQVLTSYMNEKYSFSRNIDYRSEIKRIQEEGDLWLNNINLCLSFASEYESIHAQATQDIIRVIDELRTQQKKQKQAQNQTVATSVRPSIVLITQFFASQDPVVLREMSIVLQKNLLNPAIDEVHLLTEQFLTLRDFYSGEKIVQKVIGHRLTFKEAFQYANDVLEGKIVIVANADIYFHKTLLKLKTAPVAFSSDVVMTVLKWTQSSLDGDTALSFRTDMQDAWIFMSPIAQSVIDKTRFMFGVPRCDNRLAEVLHDAGYKLHNPALDIHAIELYSAGRFKALYGLNGSVPGEVRNVYIDDLFEL